MNGYLRLIILIFPILVLVSCDHYSARMDDPNAPDLAFSSPLAIQPVTFKDFLAVEYYNLARYEQTQTYDYKAAQRYVKKADMLLSGKMVMPDQVPSKAVNATYKNELQIARQDLLNAIENYPIPENRAAFALAQTRFDCWVDQAQEWPENPERLTCKNQFFDNMNMLTITTIEPVFVDVMTETEVVY